MREEGGREDGGGGNIIILPEINSDVSVEVS